MRVLLLNHDCLQFSVFTAGGGNSDSGGGGGVGGMGVGLGGVSLGVGPLRSGGLSLDF